MAVLLGEDTVPQIRHDALVDAVMNLRLLNGTTDGPGQGVYPLISARTPAVQSKLDVARCP